MPNNSLWLTGQPAKYAPLMGETRTDVAVIGGGIAGLTAAYLLSAAGVHVSVLEAEAVGHGTAGHSTAHITSQHDLVYRKYIRRLGMERARTIARANERAIHLMAGIVAAESIDCTFLPQDSHLFTRDPRREEALEEEAEAASRLGIMADVTNCAPFLFPYHVAVRFRNQAMFHPVQYLSGLAAAVVRNGGRVYEGSRALALLDHAVLTAEGLVRAKCIVIATSAPISGYPGRFFTGIHQSCIYAAALENAPLPAGLWSDDAADGFTYRAYMDKLIMSGCDRRPGEGEDKDPADVMHGRMQELFPEARPTHFWSGQDAMTPDGLPVIGRLADQTLHLFVATGFNKWGATQGTLAGGLVCDLILDRKNPCEDIYSPQRGLRPAALARAVAASFRNLLSQ